MQKLYCIHVFQMQPFGTKRQLQAMSSVRLKYLKSYEVLPETCEVLAAIFIPSFCTVHPAFNFSPKGLST